MKASSIRRDSDSHGYMCLCMCGCLVCVPQAMAAWFNLIPLPPLDGWGALRPWLHEDCVFKRWERHPWHSKSMALVCIFILYIGLKFVSPPSPADAPQNTKILLVAVCVVCQLGFQWIVDITTEYVYLLDPDFTSQGGGLFHKAIYGGRGGL